MLYILWECPSRKGWRLTVIGIVDTLDLPERLMPRIASRLGSGLIAEFIVKESLMLTPGYS